MHGIVTTPQGVVLQKGQPVQLIELLHQIVLGQLVLEVFWRGGNHVTGFLPIQSGKLVARPGTHVGDDEQRVTAKIPREGAQVELLRAVAVKTNDHFGPTGRWKVGGILMNDFHRIVV